MSSFYHQVVWEVQERGSEMLCDCGSCQTVTLPYHSQNCLLSSSCPNACKRKAPRWKTEMLAKTQHVVMGTDLGEKIHMPRKYPKISTSLMRCQDVSALSQLCAIRNRVFSPHLGWIPKKSKLPSRYNSGAATTVLHLCLGPVPPKDDCQMPRWNWCYWCGLPYHRESILLLHEVPAAL